MKKQCREIVDRLAEGEDLGAEDNAHVASCLTCARTIETRDLIRATTERRNQVQPRPGFTSRVAAGALARSARKRRQGGIALAAVSAAAIALTVTFFMINPQPMDEHHTPIVASGAPPASKATIESDTAGVMELLELSDVDQMTVKADWKSLEQPLAPVKALAEHINSAQE